MALLETRGLSKSFGSVHANRDISFAVDAGELVCLFGENGAGKSTLSSCLSGLFPPDSGAILYKGDRIKLRSAAEAIRMGIGLVHQHFVLVPDFTVLENIIIGSQNRIVIRYDEAEARLRALCETYDIDVDPNARVGDLTVGEQQWVELLKALYFDAEVLILDEPTATLDLENSKKLFRIIGQLKADGVGLILITHKLDEVMQSDRVVVLRQGRVTGERITAETSAEELTGLMVGREVEARVRQGGVQGEPRLRLEKLTVAGSGQRPDLSEISLTVRAGEIFGIAGVAGNGQNPLMEAIAGVRRPITGKIVLDGADIGALGVHEVMTQGLGHIPEDRFLEGLVPEFSIAENLILGNQRDGFSRGGLLDRTRINDRADSDIAEFQIAAPSRDTAARNLSGGNAQRIILARELRLATRVLLANQPTRGLDVGVIEYIHRRILEKRADGVAVLLASTELEDLLNLCDRIGVMFQGRLMGVVETARTTLEEIGLLMAGRRPEATA